MSVIRWGRYTLGPGDLFTAAREARANRWLSDPARKFLYHAGICLAMDRGLSEQQAAFLARVLRRLRRRGCRVLGGGAGAAGPGTRVAGRGGTGTGRRSGADRQAPVATPPGTGPCSQAPSWDAGDVDLQALEADIAALRLFLASATERVEGYWERLQRLKQGLPPDDFGGRLHTTP